MATPVQTQCNGGAIIDYLAKQPAGTYTKDVLEFNDFKPDWWARRVPQIEFPMHMGPSPQRRVMSRQRGGEIVSAALWHPSNGSGSAADNMAAGQPIGTPANAGCCPPVNLLNRGYQNKGLNVFNWAWQGRLMCAADFDESLDPMGDLEFEFKGYGLQIEHSKAMFQRNEFIRLCQTKLYATPGTGIGNMVQTSTVGDPTQLPAAAAYAKYVGGQNPTTTDPATGVTGTITSFPNYLGLNPAILPTSKLSQGMITKVAAWLGRNGIKGLTTINGAEQYELVTAPEVADDLLHDVSNAVFFEYAEMGKGINGSSLLAGLGSTQIYRNAAYQVDDYALKLDANYNPIPATITVATDSGTEDITNPNYDRAPYMVSVMYTDEVMNVAYPKTASSPGGNVEFMPYDYLGDLIFHVLADAPLHDQGYFYSGIRVATWAGKQRYAAVIVHLCCNADKFYDCSGNLTMY